MEVVRAGQAFPEAWSSALWLAGPAGALELLEGMGYDGVVFVSEGGSSSWESEARDLADVLVGWPMGVDHPKGVPTLEEALARMGAGALRRGGERWVPLYVWNTPMFQSWYRNLVRVGNRLDEARVRWVFYLPGPNKLLASILWVKVWVEAEQRYKDNEWIFSRTDISAVVLYQRGQDVLDTEVVLVREFRSPSRTADGFVHELPGGSTVQEGLDPAQVAAKEVQEETSLVLAPERFVEVGSRQLAATLSTHHASIYAAELTAEEMSRARELARARSVHGEASDTERTIVEIATLRTMLQEQLVDWSTIGMVCQALLGGL